jgi:hypothetical protein
MDKIKRVPASEFAEHAAEYLEGSDTVAVEKDGAVIGRYVPEVNGHATNGTSASTKPKTNKAELRKAFAELDDVLQRIYERTGMTEDELADLFDTKKPFPYDIEARS